VLVARLNRPEARNALNAAVMRGIGAAMNEAESDPEIRAVVLTGTGDRAFCAGMDLRAFASGGTPGTGDDEATAGYMRLIRGEVAVPIVGAANGSAVAGGFELLLACDVIVASSQAQFGLPEVKRGLFPAGGGTFLGTRIPLGIALEIALTGDRIDAERAYALGLVNAVVGPDQVLTTALDTPGASPPTALSRWRRSRSWCGLGSPMPAAPPSACASGSRACSAATTPKKEQGRSSRSAGPSGRAGSDAGRCLPRVRPAGGRAGRGAPGPRPGIGPGPGPRRVPVAMRAAVCREYGPPEVVRVEELPAPDLGSGQARVRIQAAAVNFADVLLVANQYQMSVPPPFVPGSEYAGVVVEVANDTAGIAVGDRVFGAAMVGAFAEEAVGRAQQLARIPDGVDVRPAAAFGVAHRTAYHALRSFARLQAGDELVVLGAGGGVGLAAVQLGAAMGATVTAVASSDEKLEVAKANGATRLVNHRDGNLRATLKEVLPAGADAVLDPVGGALSEPALRALHYGGRFVTVGFAAGEIPRIPLNLVMLKGVQVLGFQIRDFGTHQADEMARNDTELMELLASGRVVPHIGASFTLDEAPAALRYVADGRAIGKVVLDITTDGQPAD
jgi:NADPH2:quinone reductase